MSPWGLGLAAALLYALSDLSARLAAGRAGVLRSMLVSQAAMFVLMSLGIAAGFLPLPPTRPDPGVWLLAVICNFGIFVATGLFYRALFLGEVSVVVPIASTSGLVTALASVGLGESLSGLAWLGMVATVTGAAIVTISPRERAGPVSSRSRVALAMALTSSVLFGVSTGLQFRFVVPRTGMACPLWLYYGLGVCLAAAAVARTRSRPLVPPWQEWPLLTCTGLLAGGAGLSLAAAAQQGAVAIPMALSSLSSVFVAAIAQVVYRDRIVPWHWLGIGLSAGGSAVLAR